MCHNTVHKRQTTHISLARSYSCPRPSSSKFPKTFVFVGLLVRPPKNLVPNFFIARSRFESEKSGIVDPPNAHSHSLGLVRCCTGYKYSKSGQQRNARMLAAIKKNDGWPVASDIHSIRSASLWSDPGHKNETKVRGRVLDSFRFCSFSATDDESVLSPCSRCRRCPSRARAARCRSLPHYQDIHPHRRGTKRLPTRHSHPLSIKRTKKYCPAIRTQ